MDFKKSITFSKGSLVTLIALFLIVGLTVFASQKKQDIRQRAATVSGKTASTNTYTLWNWPIPENGYDSFEWEITILRDPTPAGYFWAHQVLFMKGVGGFVGLQSQGDRRADGSIGKVAVFSLWKTTVSQGPSCGAFEDELNGQSCVIAYDWVVNRQYKMKLAKMSADANGIWWGAWVIDPVTKQETFIGKIQAPTEWKGLSFLSIMHSENFRPTVTDCKLLVRSSVRFSKPVANGNISPASHDNFYSEPVNCPGSSITDVQGGVRQDMGNLSNITSSPTVLPSITSRPSLIPTTFPTGVIFPTSSPDPLETPVLNPTIDPNQPATKLLVSVSFPGIGPGHNANPKHLTRQVVVGVFNTDNKLVKTGRGFLKYDQKGFFRGKIDIGTIPNGTYYVKIVSNYTLVTLVEPQFQAIKYDQDNILPVVRLFMGDFNADLKLDIKDYQLALICFQNKKCPDAKEIDINDDGKTDVVDYNLFIGNFKRYEGD